MLYISKIIYLSETNNKFITSLYNNFYPVISYRQVQKESDELLCTVLSLVMVRNQLPVQVVKGQARNRVNLSQFLRLRLPSLTKEATHSKGPVFNIGCLRWECRSTVR